MWSHGLISDITYEAFTVICNYSQVRREIVMGSLSPACSGVISQVSRELGKHIDSYDVTLDVCLPSVVSQSERLNQPVGLSHSFSFLFFPFFIPEPCFPLFLLFIYFSDYSNLISHLQRGTEKIDVCVEDETIKYLNRKDVQKALHAHLKGVSRWSICSE